MRGLGLIVAAAVLLAGCSAGGGEAGRNGELPVEDSTAAAAAAAPGQAGRESAANGGGTDEARARGTSGSSGPAAAAGPGSAGAGVAAHRDRGPTCEQLKQEAKTPEDQAALVGRCQGTADPWSARTVAGSPEHEAVTWERLAVWWPDRPLLRPARAPEGTTVRPYAWSWRGGTKADPMVDGSSATVICDTAAAGVGEEDVVGIAAAGGFVLMHLSHAVSDAFPPGSGAQAVEVRGRPGSTWTITIDAERAVRITTWREADTVMVLYSSADEHSADVQAFTSSLQPV